MKVAIFFSLCAGLLMAQGSYIGVGMQEIGPDRAKALNVPAGSGIEITSIVPDSPAEKAGLKPGDVVYKYNGQIVEGNEQFARLVRDTPPGRDVKLDLVRGGNWMQVSVKVAFRRMPHPDQGMMTPMTIPIQIQMPDMAHSLPVLRTVALGVEAEAIDGQLGQYFGVKEGVLIRSVAKGSAAEKAGIRAGDVVVKFDEAPVSIPQDISNRIRMLHGKQAQLSLVRERKELSVPVTFDEVPGGVIQMTPFQVHPPQP